MNDEDINIEVPHEEMDKKLEDLTEHYVDMVNDFADM